MSADGPVIEVNNLSKRYGNRTVVDGLTMQVQRGEIFGFLGPNGSGKTTSIRLMCGLLTPDGGAGRTLGYDVVREAAAIKREVGYMTQKFGLYEDLSVRENLDFVARIYGLDRRRQRVDAAIEQLGLSARRDQLAGSLSGGWKQRLALCACILHEPKLLLLDEPTAGVDPKARRDFWEEIHGLAARGITVLVSTHYMDEAERCTRLSYIAEGKLLANGTPDDLIAGSGLASWYVNSPDLASLAGRVKALAPDAIVTRFGNELHISADDMPQFDAAIAPLRAEPGSKWRRAAPPLEDVFINLMRRAAPVRGDAGVR